MDADRHVIVRVLDALGYSVYARGFSDGLHEGIVSLMILIVNPHSPQHALFGEFILHLEYSEHHLE
jgi:hypothetical protein